MKLWLKLCLILSLCCLASTTYAAQSPFGVMPGTQETSNFAALAPMQSQLYQSILSFLASTQTSNASFALLLGLSYLYGLIHAIGPGHSKLALSSFLLADQSALRKGIILSLGMAMMQSLVAILSVSVIYFWIAKTAKEASQLAHMLEQTSAILLIILGLWLLFKKLKSALHTHDENCGCNHVVIPSNHTQSIITVFAGGLRPCSGAILLLTLAASQNVFLKGSISIIFMGLGTASALVLLALLTIYFRDKAQMLALAGNGSMAQALKIFEILACLLIIALGVFMLGLK